MNWTKLLYVLIIVAIYIPMVFVGANVFFPKYTGANSYYQPSNDCYMKNQNAGQPLTSEQQASLESCLNDQREAQIKFEDEKNAYDGMKYVFIALFNLVILLFALFVPKLQDSVTMGLFLGSMGATFFATLTYMQTRTKIGFAVLVLTFFAMLFFINRKKDSFVDWGTRKK